MSEWRPRRFRPAREDPATQAAPRGIASRAGALERPAPQDGDLGLARVRVHRLRDRRRGRDQDPGAHPDRGWASRAGPTGQSPTAAPQHAQEMVLIQSARATARPVRAFRAVVVDAQRRLAARARHAELREPASSLANTSRISADGHSALLGFEIAGNRATRRSPSGTHARGHGRRPRGPSRFHGRTVRRRERRKGRSTRSSSATTSKALSHVAPITLIILLITFGALVAAGIPILLALTAVLGTIGIVGAGQPHLRRSTARSTR